MAILPIITAPDPRLKKACKALEKVDEDARRLMDDMLETMYNAPGIGLAAPQVGVLQRIIVVDIAREGEDPDPHFMVNPELTWVSDHDVNYEEGCLSLPEEYADVVRPAEINVSYLNRDGQKVEQEAENLLATCIQHEIDHLDGILFVDHISALRRNMILRRLLKAKRNEKPVAKYATA
jgi:peptide deformylase